MKIPRSAAALGAGTPLALRAAKLTFFAPASLLYFFVMMQLTGRTDWGRAFARGERASGPPVAIP